MASSYVHCRYSGGPASVAFLEGVLKPIQYEMMTVYYPDTIAEAHETLPFWRWPKPNSSPNIEKFTKWCSRFCEQVLCPVRPVHHDPQPQPDPRPPGSPTAHDA